MPKGSVVIQLFRNLWQALDNYFTLLQLLGMLGVSAMISGFGTWAINFISSLGIVEKIFIGIGLFCLFVVLMMFIWGRIIKKTRDKRQKNKDLIAKNIPLLAQLPITLAELNELITEKANILTRREISYSTLEKCNKDYMNKVKNKQIKKPFDIAGITNVKDIKTARKIMNRAMHKIKNIRSLINGMNNISELMEKRGIGLNPTLIKEPKYKELLSELVKQKAVANSSVCTAVLVYTNASYAGNCVYMFYAYIQRTMNKKTKKQFSEVVPEYSRPLATMRRELDDLLAKILARVEDIIIDSVS